MKTIKSRVVYKTPWMTVYDDLVDFGKGEKHSYSYVKRPDGVSVAVVNEKDEILLIKQFRYPVKKFVWEVPGGAVDAGETLKEAALREFKEETGYVLTGKQDIRLLGHWDYANSLSTEKLGVFLVQVNSNELKVKKSVGDVDEDIVKVRWFKLKEALSMVDNGQIDDLRTAHIIQLVSRKK